ncbi:MAG: EAL domain-containing protein [Nitrosomonadales bacterium]|nr:EAL domain-containing protein [Nitrosomonadales bacterium]
METMLPLFDPSAATDRFQGLFEYVSDGMMLVTPEGYIADINRGGYERLGYTKAEMVGMHMSALDAPESPADFPPCIAGQVPDEIAISRSAHKRKDGALIDVETSSRRIELDGKQYFFIVCRDIGREKEQEQQLQLIRFVMDSAYVEIIWVDKHARICYANDRACLSLGYSKEELLRLAVPDIDPLFPAERWGGHWLELREAGSQFFETQHKRKDGSVFPVEIVANYVKFGDTEYNIAFVRDIAERNLHEKQLEHLAHYDALTGIPNRTLLIDRMQQALAHSRRENKLLVICYLDLDGFKPVNDELGHKAGDRVLIEIASRLKNEIREGDTVARLGGDEFVLLLVGMENPEELAGTLQRLLASIAHPVVVDDKSIVLSASIGVAVYPDDDADADTLMRHADQAMYVAKQSGKNRCHLYDPEHDQRVRMHHEVREQIKHGLKRGEFHLFFQPKVDMRTGTLAGIEGLIRWTHPQRDLIQPAEFLYAADNTDLDIKLGEWVLRSAMEHLREWKSRGLGLELSVNISSFHLQSDGFVEYVKNILDEYHDVPPELLQIEILETAALEDIGRIGHTIEACRTMGISFALDDFGTGYSSLFHLNHLAIDTLKIDKSFVQDMMGNSAGRAIAESVTALAKAFNRKIVAEGVETEQQIVALLDMGCEIGQGYGIGRPMSAEALMVWIENWHQE